MDQELIDALQKELERIRKEYGEESTETEQEMFGMSLKDIDEQFSKLSQQHTLEVEKVHEDAVTPSYAYGSDSGFDLFSIEEVIIPPFGRALINTGLKLGIPTGTEIQVRPKSGLALNQGLTVLNTPGTVDSGYNGEIKVIVFNTTQNDVKVPKGMKIAQAVLCPVFAGHFVNIDVVDKIGEKDRGENGFGSTGIKL